MEMLVAAVEKNMYDTAAEKAKQEHSMYRADGVI
jgi:hypothetical protein